MRFAEKSVVVTGAGSGMGEATALTFAREGATVLVADIDDDAATRTVETIRAAGGRAEAQHVDLRRREEVFAMIAVAAEKFGGVHVLANVAGSYPLCRIEDMTEELWDEVFALDLKGPMFACQAALPHMIERGGAIVNVASGAAFYAIPGLAAYGAAKAGLVALTRSLALEAGPNVRVNTVVPGPTRTPGTDPARPVADYAEQTRATVNRWLDPSEIADTIVWVASDAASAVNGALLRVDDGHHMI